MTIIFDPVIRSLDDPRYGQNYSLSEKYNDSNTHEMDLNRFFNDKIKEQEVIKDKSEKWIENLQCSQSAHNQKYKGFISLANFLGKIKLLFEMVIGNYYFGKLIGKEMAKCKESVKKIEILVEDKIRFSMDRWILKQLNFSCWA
jgi:hypothetical protein